MLCVRTCSSGLRPFFAQPVGAESSSPILKYFCSQLREHLFQHLSGENSGYFASEESPIGTLTEPISFNFLLGESGWRAKQQQIYRQLQKAWLTPVELFQPWYAQAVARYIVRDHQQRRPSQPLSIVEEYLRERHAQIYSTMRYTSLDASPALVQSQKERLNAHKEHFQAFAGDARNSRTWQNCHQVYSYVLAFEVLDNLPHDCVVQREGQDEWMEVTVEQEAPGSLTLKERPLQDELIQKVLNSAQWEKAGEGEQSQSTLSRMWDAIAGVPAPSTPQVSASSPDPRSSLTGRKLFLPTGCMQLLQCMHRVLPQHHLIAADFSHFAPSDVRIAGVNAPIISHTEPLSRKHGFPCLTHRNFTHLDWVLKVMKQQPAQLLLSMQEKGKNVDHDSLLVPTGSADIFFPTDFEATKQLWMSCQDRAQAAPSDHLGVRASVQPTAVFMNTYGNTRRTKTMTAYNPLLDDFANTSFLIADTCAKL